MEEHDTVIEWMVQMIMREKSTEHYVVKLLASLTYSSKPLCHKFPTLGIPIAFMYGKRDWVSRDVAD